MAFPQAVALSVLHAYIGDIKVSLPKTSVALVLSLILFQILRGLYRITLHPLAGFPGPKLTAMTRWYEAYYEVLADGTGGKFGDQIAKWHKQYGPIVRINPFELHVDDPDYYDVLFNFDPHLEKREFAIDNLVHTASSAQHKVRRQALSNFFSRQSTKEVEQMLYNGLTKLCAHYSAARETQTPVLVSLMYKSLLADVICEYSFGRSWNFLDDPKYSEGFFKAIEDTFKNIFFFRESKLVNWVAIWMTYLPDWMLPNGAMKNLAEWSTKLRKHTEAAMNHEVKHYDGYQSHTIFEEYKTKKLPEDEKTSNRIFQVALMLVGAGFGTPSYVLDVGHYHICANPEIYARLKAELRKVWPDKNSPPPSVATLENLPYLKACVKESLRLALGVMARLQRVNHHSTMRYGNWVIPKHTPIGMSHRFIHHNEALFPNSQVFNPERWLQGEKSKNLETYLVTFSKGSRMCLAVQMGYAELYLVMATVFRHFDMELYDTDRRCIDPKYDYFAPFPERKETIRVLVK